MKKFFIVFIVFFIILVFSDNKVILPKDYQQKLGLGLNVNWASFYRYIKNSYYKEAAPLWKNLGFDSVRIRFNTYEKFKGRISEKEYLNFLKKCVDEALKHSLVPVLACGCENFKNNPTDEKSLEKTLKLWEKVAKIFKNYPYELSYDLMIEPAKKLNKNTEALNKFYERAIKIIRRYDKKRIVFIAPTHCSNPYYLKDLTIPDDKYLMIEWHFYAAGPNKKGKNKKWTNGNESERKLIKDKVKFAYEFASKKGLYTWVGAIMPGNYNKGDYYSYKEQKKFIEEVIKDLSEYKIPFALNADGQFYEPRTKKFKRKEVLDFIIKKYYMYYKK